MPIQMDGHPTKMHGTTAQRRESFRARAALAVLLAAAACNPASEAVAPFPGRSTRPAGGSTAAPSASSRAPVRWERWPELAGWRSAIERTPSQHLAADHEAETLANDAAAAYPNLGPARRLGAGAILVQRLYAPGAATPEVHFAMVRRATEGTPDDGGWEYLVLDPTGFILERGALGACARCHAEAPNDGTFGRAK
jgi:hypothetical protein